MKLTLEPGDEIVSVVVNEAAFCRVWKGTDEHGVEVQARQQDMPAGPPLCRLQPSARRTDGSGCGGAPWSTPKASDPDGGRTSKTEGGGNSHLPIAAREAWCKDYRYPNNKPYSERGASGAMPYGSPEQTAKRGALNPEFVSWLTGFPTAWVRCAVSVTRSSRRSRPSS